MEEMFHDRFDMNVNVAFEFNEADKEKAAPGECTCGAAEDRCDT